MDVFNLRNDVVQNYGDYIKSFITIRDERIRSHVESELAEGSLWPEPLVQLNPSFEAGLPLADLIEEGVLHSKCREIFRIKPEPDSDHGEIRFHKHQEEAIRRIFSLDERFTLNVRFSGGKECPRAGSRRC